MSQLDPVIVVAPAGRSLWEHAGERYPGMKYDGQKWRGIIRRNSNALKAADSSRPLTRTGKLRLFAEASELLEAIGAMPAKY
ncbi:hypothetical protein EUU23_10405 [Sphingorhabdus sp. IMCC26285]|uniref:Uncharacterized protein n=1 Tax=Sphingorhabdus profundilacus TaxID=2509718 RepID=A0A6I4M177_9SPHN|nr:hypothetical protein [Sphingorhabdus profundilacus]MVZ98103.1 hypothetical protein [Sphingorhabdus profundilacus]